MSSILKKITSVIFLTTITALSVFSQGKIAGKVIDKGNGETIIGANLTVEGANVGGVTDLDGNYFIVCPEGKYKIKVEYLGYTPITLEVTVINKETSHLDIVIAEAAEQLNEVIVQATSQVRQTENAVLVQQKNSVAMVTGISAEQFRRLPDKSTSDVLKRISGASIQENKFAIIRGLNDRYNMALLNGVPMPSTESDRKAFSFDIVPANLLDNLMITKTATPDMPGDFAGGIIQINTKDIPEENSAFFNIGTSTHSLTTFKEYFKSPSQNTTNLLGNSETANSSILSSEQALANKDINVKVAQTNLFDNNFQARRASSIAPNLSLQGGISRRINLWGNPLGILFSTTYSKGYRYSPFSNNNPVLSSTQQEFDIKKADGDFFNINSYKTSINSGTILNLSYRIGLNNKISFKNLYTVNSDDQSILRNGNRFQEGRQSQSILNDYGYLFQDNKMLSSQLIGESSFGASKIKLRYNVGYTNITRVIPDFKRLFYTSDKPTGEVDFFPSQAIAQPQSAIFSPFTSGRFSSKLNENVYSGSYSLNIPFVFLIKNELKLGGFHQYRDRDFAARNYVYSFNENTFNEDFILQESPEQVFMGDNIRKDRITQKESTSPQDKYVANSTLNAGFIMLDNKFNDKFRLIWGLRIEAFNQKLISSYLGKPIDINKNWVDPLPSLNFIYSINEKSNARFSYSKTLSRPEFREFAPFAFLDFNLNAVVNGQPNLNRATIHNIDLKYEFYPGEGQIIAITPFYKQFTNPVESTVEGIANTRAFSFINAKSAQNIGVELEYRTSLKRIDNLLNTNFFDKLSLYTNYALIRSTVDLKGTLAENLGNRPLQGQSPYVFNGGIQYSHLEKGIDVTLAANRVGRRVAFVANESQFLIYENSRTVLDFSISKKFFKKLTARVIIGDILAKSQPLIFYQDLNNNKQYDKNTDVESFKYLFGWTSNFSLGYTF
ncbi:MAG: TonB-dependent receptor [Cytophagales bacterium]|nr:MAG: TonB-dependent receptor [Cytophagales bacterium]